MRPIFILICLLCTVSLSLFAQSKAEQALQHFYNKFPVEKVYIQYTHQDYIAGEELRFKCYVFDAYQLTQNSTNLYVELYNQEKQLLDKTIVPLLNGVGESTFELNKAWPEGVFYIRAYTRWMLNFDEALPYVHSFQLYNPSSALRLQPKAISWTAVAYPESGAIVAGLENKVAIRLFTDSFLPDQWSGVIKEKANPEKELVHFTSLNQEIASFSFLPQAGKSYYAVISDRSGRKQTIPLPEVQTSGILLQTLQEDDTLTCKLQFRGLSERGVGYTLLGQMQQQMVYKAKIKNYDSTIIVKVPTRQLTNGILHLTLFDKNERAVAERLVFATSHATTSTSLSFDTLSLQRRALNHWRFPMDSTLGYSYTAIVEDVNTPQAKDNILSSLWLSNDIRYPSTNPAWYFQGNKMIQKEALDAFLITEKWRWFNWKQLLDGHYPNTAYEKDHYLSFTGTIFKRKKLLLNTDVNLIFQFHDKSFVLQQFTTDSTGSFPINGALFADTVRVFYMLNSSKQSAKDIRILFEQNNSFKKLLAPLPRNGYNLVARQLTDTLNNNLSRRMLAYTNQKAVEDKYIGLMEVTVRASRKELTDRLNKKLSSALFRSLDEQVYDFENDKTFYKSAGNVYSWLLGRVPHLYRPGGGMNIPIFLDEQLVGMNTLNSLSLSDVAMIKVIRGFNSMAGFSSYDLEGRTSALSSTYNNTTDRAIAIYTRRGSRTAFSGLPQHPLPGYKLLKPVFAMNYADEFYKNINKDSRELLFWDTLISDNENQASIRFYMNDVSKELSVTVIGFDKGGNPVFIQQKVPASN